MCPDALRLDSRQGCAVGLNAFGRLGEVLAQPRALVSGRAGFRLAGGRGVASDGERWHVRVRDDRNSDHTKHNARQQATNPTPAQPGLIAGPPHVGG